MLRVLLLPFLAIFLLQLILFLGRPADDRQALSEKGTALQKRLNLLGVIFLAGGLLAAGSILWTMGRVPEDGPPAIGYEVGNGYSYPITAKMDKRHDMQMEQIGGKANVAVAEFADWCGSLWHGRRLAYTVAVLCVGSCFVCFYLARQLPE
jgi:hypothetical protein